MRTPSMRLRIYLILLVLFNALVAIDVTWTNYLDEQSLRVLVPVLGIWFALVVAELLWESRPARPSRTTHRP